MFSFELASVIKTTNFLHLAEYYPGCFSQDLGRKVMTHSNWVN